MKLTTLPEVNKDRFLVFDGIVDTRYSFPVWSWMSRRQRVYFLDGDRDERIGGFGTMEVLAAAAEHRELNPPRA